MPHTTARLFQAMSDRFECSVGCGGPFEHQAETDVFPGKRSYALAAIARAVRRYRARAQHHALVKKHQLVHFMTRDWSQSEARARDMLARAERAAPWVPAPLYPAGGALGPLLLYLLIRALSELPVRRVLELGAGQSTQVLEGWAEATAGTVLTFEHDASWAAAVGTKLRSGNVRILHLPLVEQTSSRGRVSWYSSPPAGLLPEPGFDLVLVDGPVGAARLSRYGVVEHIPEWVGPEWLLLWDDLDRPADLTSYALLIERLRKLGVVHEHVLFDGDRTVGLICTPRFRAARFMW